ncbi:MAG: tetratricopeptide repeat protein [Dolichospermum sp. DET73]|jgi:tetratricopeptide (TPR) repeat protein|nr:tetratricopeptide repeat protein [Dolichospermum sp. DET73]
MNVEDAMNFANTLVHQQTGQYLNAIQTIIIRQLWSDPRLNYIKIASDNEYSHEYIKQVGKELWHTLTTSLREPVSKANFKVVFERRWNLQSPPPIIDNPEYDPNFVGRKISISHIDSLINEGAKIIQIIAPGGTGKTILAQKYFQNKFKIVIEFTIAKETKDIASVQSLLAGKLRELDLEPGPELMVSLDRLKQKLQTEEIGIFIDNLEPALDASGQFIEQHRSYVELLRVLTDSSVKSFTLITSREKLHEASIEIETYRLPGLTLEAWKKYFNNQKIIINTDADKKSLQEIRDAFGGNAKAMDVISKVIIQDYDVNLEKYWLKNKEYLLIEPTLENLIKEQFKRLQSIDLNDAYNLLCRMGCYRYQDVPTVPEKGLFCLLWDVGYNKHQRIIRVLKERGLVEFKHNQYWLHPVIREEAIDKLRNSQDWEKANIQTAEFWTESVKSVETVKDALTAFESYYHYLNIENYDKAGYVIAKKLSNRIEQNVPLGVEFYRFGLLEEMKAAINIIIDKVKTSYTLSRLHNIVGDLYWMTGELSKAIKHHQKCQEIAIQLILDKKDNNHINYIHNLNVASSFNMGLCYIDLWDFTKAANCVNKSICLYEELKSEQRYLENSIFILAYIHSQINSQEESLNLLNQCNFEFDSYQRSVWGVGYSYIFYALTCKNLKKINDSFESYQQAINFAEEVNYPQVKGKALTGLAELYRIQNDFKTALTHHQESIEILNKISAKCDLAEAYFQQALTHQKIGDNVNSEEYFHKAMYLWSPQQIDAPKQIERVLKAMNSEP